VRVRGVDAALVEVDARSRDPERVQSREVGDGGRGHGRHVLIAGVAAILEGGGGEVPHRHLVGGLAGEAVDGGEGGGVVGDAEVLQGILVGGHGQHGHERGHAHQHGHRHPQAITAEDAHDVALLAPSRCVQRLKSVNGSVEFVASEALAVSERDRTRCKKLEIRSN
jgi:hypothetical protein